MFSKLCRDNITTVARAYAQAKGVSLSAVSKEFYGKSSFLDGFGRGEVTVSVEKYGEMVERFAASWPDGAKWPLLRAIIIPGPGRGKSIPR